jgi:hypothetical protein
MLSPEQLNKVLALLGDIEGLDPLPSTTGLVAFRVGSASARR